MATKPLPTALPQIKIHPVSGEAIGCDCYRGLDDLMNRNRRSICALAYMESVHDGGLIASALAALFTMLSVTVPARDHVILLKSYGALNALKTGTPNPSHKIGGRRCRALEL